jgi:hypothetical protein
LVICSQEAALAVVQELLELLGTRVSEVVPVLAVAGTEVEEGVNEKVTWTGGFTERLTGRLLVCPLVITWTEPL